MDARSSEAAKAAGFFKPRRLGHVNFWVDDHQGVADFYSRVAGIDEAYRRAAIPAVFMSNGNTYHDVAFMDLSGPRGAGHKPGLHHFAFELECEKDLVDGYFASRDAGFAFDFTISADVTNSAYGSDPDGNRFEVYADVKPNWRALRSGAVSTGAIPWRPGETKPITDRLYPIDPEISVRPDAVFKTRRAAHAVLVAKDYAAMVAHYIEVVGLTPLAGGAGAPFTVLAGTLGEESLAIFRPGAGLAPGLHHFGLELESVEALEEGRARLLASGARPTFETDHPTRRSLFLSDPAGQLIQFYATRSVDPDSWASLSEEVALGIL